MPDPGVKITREQQLIESIKEWTGSGFIGDDCAVLPNQQLVTTDSLIEGTHFQLSTAGFADIGWKTAAVNLSDVAAMAGRPRYMLVATNLGPGMSKDDFRDFYESLAECARAYRTQIVGGDITKGALFAVNCTIIADIHENGCLTRAQGRPGDVVVVTGDFGASAAGLWLLQNDLAGKKRFSHCLTRHLRPLPRLCESWALVRKTGSRGSLMDASDGLADAVFQIARASGVGMEIDLDRLPLHPQTKEVARLAQVDALDWALYGGEDYELVGTLAEPLWRSWDGAPDNPFRMIGKVTKDGSITFTAADREPRELDLSRCFEQVSFE
jgi:thiamine-monophosphate kinase